MSKISVSTLVRYLKNKLDSDENLQGVLVGGELSNFHKHNSGHLYFTLKDEYSAISCVMFSSKARNLNFVPKNGDKVIISANTSVFEVSGQLQLYVNSMKLDGIGDLYQQYEMLKNKLAEEGLFDDDNKVVITTSYPENVAVLVGDKSAAMSDIKTQFNRRWPLCHVDYYPVLVQGVTAASDIIENLIRVDEMGYDAIILARGGGSFEDLFCFNDEKLVRTIYSLKTFVVTGIGHEQDYTLSDFVADLRAPTPTATVELITPNISDVSLSIEDYTSYMKTLLDGRVSSLNKDLNVLVNNKYLVNPHLLVNNNSLKLDYYDQKLSNFNQKANHLLFNVNLYSDKMLNSISKKLRDYSVFINKYSALLEAYSLNKTLKRGFSIIYKGEEIIKSSKNLKDNDNLIIKFADGITKATVKEN